MHRHGLHGLLMTRRERLQARFLPRQECRSQQPPLGKRHAGPVADDDVVEHAHVDQCEGLAQAPGDVLVGLAGLGHARGVVVGEDGRGRVVVQGAAHYLAGVHARAVDAAAEQLLVGEDAVAVVELCVSPHNWTNVRWKFM